MFCPFVLSVPIYKMYYTNFIIIIIVYFCLYSVSDKSDKSLQPLILLIWRCTLLAGQKPDKCDRTPVQLSIHSHYDVLAPTLYLYPYAVLTPVSLTPAIFSSTGTVTQIPALNRTS